MPRRETEFIRREMSFERDFLQVRNWWTRDKRIVGNPLSILLYLLSHRVDFRVTQSKVMRDLGLGKDAYLSARRKLERAGFLDVVEHRYPAGETDDLGNSIAGHKWTELIVQDPAEPSDGTVRSEPDRAPNEDSRATEDFPARRETRRRPPVDNAPRNAVADYPPRHGAHAGGALGPVVEPPSTDNPAPEHPLVKEHQHQEDVSFRSTTRADSSARTTPADRTAASVPAGCHPTVHSAAVAQRLQRECPTLDPSTIDLDAAVSQILAAAPRRVGDPVAYVCASVLAEPERWRRGGRVTLEKRATSRPPTTRECASAGHRWIGAFNEICIGCGAERPGWRDDRDQSVSPSVASHDMARLDSRETS